MIKPWNVMEGLMGLVDIYRESGGYPTLKQITDILDEDSSGTWVPDDIEQREQLEMLGIEWSDIEEIFENEIENLVMEAAAKRAQVMPR